MNRLKELQKWFSNKKGVLVAFSGGVDSSLLLKVGYDVLGDQIVAVTAASPLNAEQETLEAQKIAEEIGAKHIVIRINDLENDNVSSNPPERCYFCKKERFERLLNLAQKMGLEAVVEGSNIDDLSDYRPGLKAVKELNISSPLMELGFSKENIRFFAKEVGLSVWNKPSEPCLATRIPYNEKLTIEKLVAVLKAESFLSNLGFSQIRVRSHNGLARIEVSTQEQLMVLEYKEIILDYLKGLGFNYITMDLQGYRTGSMNQEL